MIKINYLLAIALSVSLAGCTSSKKAPEPTPAAVFESTAPRIYVTNEVSGDLTVIDSGTAQVIATVPLGKRPRGIHASPDHKTIYVALSGSPIGGPNRGRGPPPPPPHPLSGTRGFFPARRPQLRRHRRL